MESEQPLIEDWFIPTPGATSFWGLYIGCMYYKVFSSAGGKISYSHISVASRDFVCLFLVFLSLLLGSLLLCIYISVLKDLKVPIYRSPKLFVCEAPSFLVLRSVKSSHLGIPKLQSLSPHLEKLLCGSPHVGDSLETATRE